MAVSTAMKNHLAGNVCFLCEVWRMVARDSTAVAYAAHTRNISYNSFTYQAAPIEATQSTRKLGLEADSFEINGVFDDVLTEASFLAGKWKGARVTKERINYLDTSMGYATKEVGFAGKVNLRRDGFTIECLSLSSLLSQEIGDLTGPLDRRGRLDELGIDITSYTHTTTISTVTSQIKFKVPYVQPSTNYFRNGLLRFTSGLNNGIEKEIKTSTTTDSGTRTELELYEAMPYNPAASDALTLYRGYARTREDATSLGTTIDFQGEPDVPGINELIQYPSS